MTQMTQMTQMAQKAYLQGRSADGFLEGRRRRRCAQKA